MHRTILRFELDAAADWAADLSCGHRRHTRHNPPLAERSWVLSKAGREDRIGTRLDCSRCDAAEIPPDYAAYKRTPSFTQDSVPAALLRAHATKPGVWALIHVVAGRLEYVQRAPFDSQQELTPAEPGMVVAEVEHHVRCPFPVEFYVEFWRRDPAAA